MKLINKSDDFHYVVVSILKREDFRFDGLDIVFVSINEFVETGNNPKLEGQPRASDTGHTWCWKVVHAGSIVL